MGNEKFQLWMVITNFCGTKKICGFPMEGGGRYEEAQTAKQEESIIPCQKSMIC